MKDEQKGLDLRTKMLGAEHARLTLDMWKSKSTWVMTIMLTNSKPDLDKVKARCCEHLVER